MSNELTAQFAVALRNGNDSMIAHFLDVMPELTETVDIDAILWDKALACDEKAVKLLQSLGAKWNCDPCDVGDGQLTPGSSWLVSQSARSWSLPTGKDHKEVAQFFADHGAPYDKLLLRAAELDDVGVVEFVLSVGVPGDAALLHAAECGAVDSVSVLLQAGVNPNVRNAGGQTPLHLCAAPIGAAEWGWEFKGDEIAKLLLAVGADVGLADDRGWSPLHAVAWDKYSARHETSWDRDTVPEEMARLTQVLIDAGAGVNRAAHDGSTPLHVAAASGNVAVARVLVDFGADSRVKNADARTAVDIAAESGKVELLAILPKVSSS